MKERRPVSRRSIIYSTFSIIKAVKFNVFKIRKWLCKLCGYLKAHLVILLYVSAVALDFKGLAECYVVHARN